MGNIHRYLKSKPYYCLQNSYFLGISQFKKNTVGSTVGYAYFKIHDTYSWLIVLSFTLSAHAEANAPLKIGLMISKVDDATKGKIGFTTSAGAVPIAVNDLKRAGLLSGNNIS